MRLGVFAKTYVRPSLDACFAAAARDGLRAVQFNLACAGVPTLPDAPVPDILTREVCETARRHGAELAAVSGTFNMAHPDEAVRQDGGRRLRHVIVWAATAGVPVVTLCTGSRDAVDMWRDHPENGSPAARHDFLQTLTPALVAAEAAGVTLAIEPEPGNVVADAAGARRLLDALRSPRLRIILDPANLIRPEEPADRNAERLTAAVALLAVDTVIVHAKDRRADGTVCPAGGGVVPFLPFLQALQRAGYGGPLIIHGIDEPELPAAVTHLQETLAALATGPAHALR